MLLVWPLIDINSLVIIKKNSHKFVFLSHVLPLDDSSGVKSELEEMDITEAVTSPDSPTQDESTSETKKATKKNKKCAKRLRDMGAKGPVVTDDRLTFEFSKHNWLEKKYRPSLDGDKG